MLRRGFLLLLCVWPLGAQTKKILIVNPDPALLTELQSVTPRARVVAATKDTVAREIADADAFIGDITPEQVRMGKNLKWVQVMSAGVERVLHLSGSSDLRDSSIVLTNNQIVQGPEIADHAFALLLSLTRGINKFVLQNRNISNSRLFSRNRFDFPGQIA